MGSFGCHDGGHTPRLRSLTRAMHVLHVDCSAKGIASHAGRHVLGLHDVNSYRPNNRRAGVTPRATVAMAAAVVAGIESSCPEQRQGSLMMQWRRRPPPDL